MAVDFDDGCVDHGVFQVWLIRAGLKKSDEDIGLDPIPISLEDRIERTCSFGAAGRSLR
jgi:hypothetical protein